MNEAEGSAARLADASLQPKQRQFVSDQQWTISISGERLHDTIFTRVNARSRVFTKVDFRYSVFDNCYLRDCTYDSCDFTGCKFTGTSFHGSTFSGCKFDYAIFERTIIDSAILDTCCPSYENLKLRFARTLRVNYQAMGDAIAANKAVLVELDATRIHTQKAWRSNEAYYRKKYVGLHRLKAFLDWFGFKALDILWGNGESPAKLARSVAIFLIVLAVWDDVAHRNPHLVESLGSALVDAPQVFLGTLSSPFSGLVTAGVVLVRLVTFGLFVSILVRRFARR